VQYRDIQDGFFFFFFFFFFQSINNQSNRLLFYDAEKGSPNDFRWELECEREKKANCVVVVAVVSRRRMTDDEGGWRKVEPGSLMKKIVMWS